VENASNCQLEGGFIDYFTIVYCDVSAVLVPLSVTVMVSKMSIDVVVHKARFIFVVLTVHLACIPLHCFGNDC
jgi:hypothetical protein